MAGASDGSAASAANQSVGSGQVAVWKGDAMQQRTRTRWWLFVLLVSVGIAAFAVLWPMPGGIRWDGGFRSVECRLRFVDNLGNPVKGVTLTVRTRAGGVCHFYPVDEFVADQPVTSDADGWMVFHHTENGIEFSGTAYTNVLGMSLGGDDAPHYDCFFTLGDREVFRTPYDFHGDKWKKFQRGVFVKEWGLPGVDIEKYKWEEKQDYQGWGFRMFDSNKDGTIDREEAVAARHAISRLEDERSRVEAAKAGKVPELGQRTREVSFLVIERTIAVPNP
jgi:hypothetical protein